VFVRSWKCAIFEKRQPVKTSNFHERSNQKRCGLENKTHIKGKYRQRRISDLGTVYNRLSTRRGGFNLHGWVGDIWVTSSVYHTCHMLHASHTTYYGTAWYVAEPKTNRTSSNHLLSSLPHPPIRLIFCSSERRPTPIP